MYKKILVPLDGSELGECGLLHVKAIASGCQVPEVILLGVMEPLNHVVNAYLGDTIMKEANKVGEKFIRDYIAKTTDKLNKEGITAKSVILEGRASEAIVDYAKKNGVDLIIMSTHGASGVTRWAIGSVADEVVRHSVSPVLLAAPKACRS